MPTTPSAGAHSELDRVRHEYESSASWRVTRPLRAAGRLVRRFEGSGVPRGAPGATNTPPAPLHGSYDAWLSQFFGEQLEAIDAACADGAVERFALFRDLSDDLWALLLTRDYALYPNVRALLPDMPEPWIQQLWNGASGAALAAQGQAFYVK